MPCCAFAAFILGQVILAIGAIKRSVFGASIENSPASNAVVAWSLGQARPALTPRRGIAIGHGRIFAAAACIELLLVAGAIYGIASPLHSHPSTHQFPICSKIRLSANR